MNLKMRLKDERRLGLSEGRAEGRDEMALGLIHALQAQGMPQKTNRRSSGLSSENLISRSATLL